MTSRPTVRRAIQEMVDKGLLVRRRGLGTTVANRKVHRRVALSSLYDDLAREGRTPRTVLLEHEIVTDDAAAAVRDALAQVQMLYVKETGEGPAAPGDPDPRAGDAEGREAEARDAEERAKARSKIWTPGS